MKNPECARCSDFSKAWSPVPLTGIGRMTGKPACTLLHLGPGLANGLANLHNARRAHERPSSTWWVITPPITGKLDAPLTSDIEGFASPVSGWIQVSESAEKVAVDAARKRFRRRMQPPGQIATLILPADTAWNPANGGGRSAARTRRPRSGRRDAAVDSAVTALRSGEPCALFS